MKNFNLLKKILLLFICLTFGVKGFCADFNFEKRFISDGSNFLPDRYENPLNSVLTNLHKETGCTLIVLTINSLVGDETYKDVERQILSKYILSSDNQNNWAMIIVTRYPYRMNIRVGKGLKKIIPPKTARSMGFEFFINRIMHTETINGRQIIQENGAANNLYSTTLFLAELIADSEGKRLHSNEVRQTYDLLGTQFTQVITPETYFPPNPPVTKFIRKNNLLPIIIIILIGLSPYMILPRQRRHRIPWFGK